MAELSIFIDESGDFGANSKYYLMTLVFHEQRAPIVEPLATLDRQLRYLDFPQDCAIHTGPMIRREDMYAGMDVPARKRIFTRLYAFTKKCGIAYKAFANCRNRQ